MGGPQLLLEPRATPGVMAAKLLLPHGSARDPEGQRGAHQLLAALLTRGCGPYNHEQLAELIEGRGAGLRSEAHEDGLLISLRCASEDALELLPSLAWMVTAPHLEPDQLELERQLAVQGLLRQREDPVQIAFDGWRNLTFGQGGYGHDPLGVEADLIRLERSALEPLATDLQRQPAVLALCGQWPEPLTQQLGSLPGFMAWPAAHADPGLLKDTAAERSEGRWHESVMATEQVVVMLGQATIPHGHPDDLALRLLACHLGAGMSGLLFQRLREEHGVAYETGVHHPVRAGAAPFLLHASTSAERADLTLRLLMQIWGELREELLDEADLALARAKFTGQIAHAGQTCSQRAERNVQLCGLGLPQDFDHRCLDSLDSVDANAIRQVADRWLRWPSLSLCGPRQSLETLKQHWCRQSSLS
jgi:zinc protease